MFEHDVWSLFPGGRLDVSCVGGPGEDENRAHAGVQPHRDIGGDLIADHHAPLRETSRIRIAILPDHGDGLPVTTGSLPVAYATAFTIAPVPWMNPPATGNRGS